TDRAFVLELLPVDGLGAALALEPEPARHLLLLEAQAREPALGTFLLPVHALRRALVLRLAVFVAHGGIASAPVTCPRLRFFGAGAKASDRLRDVLRAED